MYGWSPGMGSDELAAPVVSGASTACGYPLAVLQQLQPAFLANPGTLPPTPAGFQEYLNSVTYWPNNSVTNAENVACVNAALGISVPSTAAVGSTTSTNSTTIYVAIGALVLVALFLMR